MPPFCHPEPAYAEAMLWLRAGRLVSGSRTARKVGYGKKFDQRYLPCEIPHRCAE